MEERVGGEEFCRKHYIGGAVASAWARWRIAVRSPNFIWRMDVTPGEKYDAVAKHCGYFHLALANIRENVFGSSMRFAAGPRSADYFHTSCLQSCAVLWPREDLRCDSC